MHMIEVYCMDVASAALHVVRCNHAVEECSMKGVGADNGSGPLSQL